MASTTLDVTGKDTSISVVANGALLQVFDQVTEFDARETNDDVRTKHLGRSGSRVQKIFVGWEGSIAFTRQSAALDDLIDLITALRKARVPYELNITSVTIYRDGSSKTHLYRDCEIGFDTRTRRGEADVVNLPWLTGNDRIAA